MKQGTWRSWDIIFCTSCILQCKSPWISRILFKVKKQSSLKLLKNLTYHATFAIQGVDKQKLQIWTRSFTLRWHESLHSQTSDHICFTICGNHVKLAAQSPKAISQISETWNMCHRHTAKLCLCWRVAVLPGTAYTFKMYIALLHL